MMYSTVERKQDLAAGAIDPALEEAYWREHFADRPYVGSGTLFNEYRPAYRYGVEAHWRCEGCPYEQVEAEFMRDWDHIKGTSSLTSEDAALAARDAWQKIADTTARSTEGDLRTTGT